MIQMDIIYDMPSYLLNYKFLRLYCDVVLTDTYEVTFPDG